MDSEAYAKFLEHSRSTHPLGRAGTVQEVLHVQEVLSTPVEVETTFIQYHPHRRDCSRAILTLPHRSPIENLSYREGQSVVVDKQTNYILLEL